MDWRLLIGVICIIGIVLAGSSAYVTLVNSQRAIHYNELGLKAMEDGDYYAAIEYFSMAVAADPNFAIAYYNRGNAYGNEEQFHRYYKLPGQTFTEAGYPEMQEKYEKAISDFERCMEVDPRLAPLAHFGIGNINFLYYCGYENRLKYVVPEFEKALEEKEVIMEKLGKEGLAAVYTNLARTYLAMAELEKAYEYYAKAIELYPIDTAYEHQAWVAVEMGRFDEAYKLAQEFLKHPEWEMDLGLMPAAIAAYHLGKYEEAKEYCEKIIEKFPDSAYVGEAHRLLAEIYREMGELDREEAELRKDIEVCSRVLEENPIPGDIPGARYERGVAYFKLGEYGKAIEDFKWIIEHPEITKREVAHENYYLEAHIALACAYAKLGRIEEAKCVLEKILGELDEDVAFTGWRKYIKDDIEALYSDISEGRAVDIPVIFTDLSH